MYILSSTAIARVCRLPCTVRIHQPRASRKTKPRKMCHFGDFTCRLAALWNTRAETLKTRVACALALLADYRFASPRFAGG